MVRTRSAVRNTGFVCNWATSRSKSAHALISRITRTICKPWCICEIFAGYLRLQPEGGMCIYANTRPEPCKASCKYTCPSAPWYCVRMYNGEYYAYANTRPKPWEVCEACANVLGEFSCTVFIHTLCRTIYLQSKFWPTLVCFMFGKQTHSCIWK